MNNVLRLILIGPPYRISFLSRGKTRLKLSLFSSRSGMLKIDGDLK